jgi:uncharacterized protein (DUF2236 family)
VDVTQPTTSVQREPGAPGLPIVRDAVRRVLTRLFGPPPFDPNRDPGDPGLTGPDSPSWRVIGEPAAIAGGVRGLLTQVSHPLAMAGVYDHSSFREDPLGRLQRTSAYVTTSTFGSTAEAIAVAGRVRAVHPRVVGTAPDGRPYRADDPRLLVWVSIALTSSFLTSHRLWAPDVLTPAEEDRFVAEQSRIGALLDPAVDLRMLRDPETRDAFRAGELDDELGLIGKDLLPLTSRQLDEALASFFDEIGINHQGREALSFLRWPPIPKVARAGYQSLLLGAIGALTPELRHALELDRTARLAPAFRAQTGVTLRVMRLTTGTSPSMRAAHARASAPPGA